MKGLVAGTQFVEPDPTRTMATCISFTNLHYRSFDGNHFNFRGDCAYVLVEDLHYQQFRVSVDNSYACIDAMELCNERVSCET